VREAALGALEGVSPEIRTRLVPPLLGDSVRAVRITAARQLADVPREALDEQQRAERARALDEYVRAQQSNADRPEAHLSLGVLYTALGEYDEAETAYRAALKLEPRFIAAYVNLADLYRLRRDEVAGERVLRAAIALEPGNADAHHALGLTLIRRKHMDEAIEALRRAAALAPDNARYAYVYAISLDSTGRRDEAIRLLEGALARHPGDVDIINALIAFNRQNGDEAAAQRYADRLRGIFSSGAVPGDD
jgi:Flp pilus assembly protein TadD